MHKKNKRLFWTILAWIIWAFFMSSWAIFSGIPQPLLPMTYNLLSLIVVFYAIRWVAAKYWNNIHSETRIWATPEGLESKYPSATYYLLRWQVVGIVAIVLGYIGVSWLMDGLFVKLQLLRSRQPNFYYYTYIRWITEALCVCGGNVMAAIEYHFRKEKEKEVILLEGYKEQYQKVQEYDVHIKEVVDKYLAPGANSSEPATCRCCGRIL